MNQRSCAFEERPHGGDVKSRIDILPESLHLTSGSNEDIGSIRSLVSVHLCEDHWEKCKDLVLVENQNILPLLHTNSQNTISYYTNDDRRASPLGELESDCQDLIRRSLEENPRNSRTRRQMYGKDKDMDEIFDKELIERFLTRDTLKELSPNKYGKTESLKHQLVDELVDRGFRADRIFKRRADIEASRDGQTFYFQVWWLTEDSDKVSSAERVAPVRRRSEDPVWEHSMPSDSYYAPDSQFPGESQLRHFADDRGGIPVQAVKWKDDDEWYIFYQQPSKYGEYITIEDATWVPIRVFNNFTPLPTLDDFPQLVEDRIPIDSMIDENLEEIYSDLPLSKRLVGRYRRFRSYRL